MTTDLIKQINKAYTAYKANPCMGTYRPLLPLLIVGYKGTEDEVTLCRNIEFEIENS